MTERQAADADNEWANYHERNKIISDLTLIGKNEEDLNQIINQLSISQKSAFIELVNLAATQDSNLFHKKCGHQLLVREAIQNKQDFRSHQRQASLCELLLLKRHNVIKKVQILCASEEHRSCLKCLSAHGTVYNIDEALEKMPLPCETCTTPSFAGGPSLCRCMWISYRDKMSSNYAIKVTAE